MHLLILRPKSHSAKANGTSQYMILELEGLQFVVKSSCLCIEVSLLMYLMHFTLNK